jgi:EF-P beta-lysylation protein EpmB
MPSTKHIISTVKLSEPHTWHKDLADAITNPVQLLEMLNLSADDFVDPISARTLFPMRVPLPFIAKMNKQDVNDPLLLQVLPDHREFTAVAGYGEDPLEEQQSALPGLLHKYKSRVLIVFRSGCAVNCRYCFRRHFPYQDNSINKNKLLEILDYVRNHSEINEVILSGGDPLMAKDKYIEWFIEQLETIETVSRLRIHTRLPVVIPNRLTQELATMLGNSRLNCAIVLHINHGNEIDDELALALVKFRQASITLLNQAVLLKGINNSVEAQVVLSERLFDAGVLPYYLHVLDKVEGTAHFDTDESEAKAIAAGLLAELPGFLIPKLVREIAGQPSKTPI